MAVKNEDDEIIDNTSDYVTLGLTTAPERAKELPTEPTRQQSETLGKLEERFPPYITTHGYGNLVGESRYYKS